MSTCSDDHNHQVRIFDIGFSIALGCPAATIRDAYVLEVISFQTLGDCPAVEHARRDCHAGEGDRGIEREGARDRVHAWASQGSAGQVLGARAHAEVPGGLGSERHQIAYARNSLRCFSC
jgi:hypothetical protein